MTQKGYRPMKKDQNKGMVVVPDDYADVDEIGYREHGEKASSK